MENILEVGISSKILQQVDKIEFLENSGDSLRLTPVEEIKTLLTQTVIVGGKRLRPMLTLLMGNFFRIQEDKAKSISLAVYARSIELVHAASLAHDDVIDGATERRGIASINALSSNKHAILAGDFLLGQVIVDVCVCQNLAVVQELSRVIQDLSLGEWIQLKYAHSPHISQDLISEVALKKTSSVMSFCALAPALLAQLTAPSLQLARDFGNSLGLAFQYIDDTLDFDPESKTGKNRGQDLKNGIVNSVAFEYFQRDQTAFSRFTSRQTQEDELSLWNPVLLKEARTSVYQRAQLELKKAHQALDALYIKENADKESYHSLQFLLNFLLLREK